MEGMVEWVRRAILGKGQGGVRGGDMGDEGLKEEAGVMVGQGVGREGGWGVRRTARGRAAVSRKG